METDKKLDMLYGLRLQKESRELEKFRSVGKPSISLRKIG